VLLRQSHRSPNFILISVRTAWNQQLHRPSRSPALSFSALSSPGPTLPQRRLDLPSCFMCRIQQQHRVFAIRWPQNSISVPCYQLGLYRSTRKC
jgi:hypothetical protein